MLNQHHSNNEYFSLSMLHGHEAIANFVFRKWGWFCAKGTKKIINEIGDKEVKWLLVLLLIYSAIILITCVDDIEEGKI